MRYAIVVLVTLAGISAETLAQTYGLGNTNPAVFSKFTIPKTELSSLWFGSDFYGSTYKNSILNPVGPNSNSFQNILQFTFSPRYYFLKESDDEYLSVKANIDGTVNYSDNRTEDPGTQSNQFQKNASDELDLSMMGSYRNYPGGGNFFYSLSSNDYSYLTSQRNFYPTSDSTHYEYYIGTKDQYYTLSIGIGWGRLRNVTSVVSAIRFQERMKQLNLLNSDLSEKTIEDLAQQFYRQGYYSSVYVRPDKYFWQDVQKTLAADGVSLAGLNQYADSFLREVPGELRFSRYEGLAGGAGLKLEYSNHYYSALYRPPNGYITEDFFSLGRAYLQFSHQLDLNSQVSLGLSAEGGPNLTKHSGIRQEYRAGFGAEYDYGLTDRIVTSVRNDFVLTFENSNTHGRELSEALSLSVNYFVEDNVSLNASYYWSYRDDNGMDELAAHTRLTNNQLSFGVTYYISRGFLYN